MDQSSPAGASNERRPGKKPLAAEVRRIAANVAKLPELLRQSARDAQLLLDVARHRVRQACFAEVRKAITDSALP